MAHRLVHAPGDTGEATAGGAPPPAAAAVPPLDGRAAARWRERVLANGKAPWLHGEVARRMAERLAVIRAVPQRVLDWGGADGASQDLLRERYPRAERVVCEPLLAGRPAPAPRRPWWRPSWLGSTAAAAPAWHTPAALRQGPRVQLVWSNLHLHWSTDLASDLHLWHDVLDVDGFVMLSCYGPDTVRELDAVFAAAGWGAPRVAPMDMHDLGDALVHAGFADPVVDMERLVLTWPDADALLAELRTLGANAHLARFAGWRTPRWRARLAAALTEQLRGSDGRLQLSVELVYGHAFRPPQRARVGGQTTISEVDMRALLRRPGGAAKA